MPTVKLSEDNKPVAEMVELFLNKTGYTKDHTWECRIDKLQFCPTESRPVRVMGWKPYGVVLRIKPTANATVDHQLTLQVPEGSDYSPESVFNQLRNSEKSISRIIRQQKEIKMEPQILEEEEIDEVEENQIETSTPRFKNLRGIVRNSSKLHFVLTKTDKVQKTGFCHNKMQFIEAVREECKWNHNDHSLGAITRVYTELTKYQFVMEEYNNNNKLVGWCLTDKGQHYVQFKGQPVQTIHTPKIVVDQPEFNVVELLLKYKGQIQELSDVANRLYTNITERQHLHNKLAAIDKENEELMKVVNNNQEAYEILQKLGHIIAPIPLQGKGT